MIKLTLNPDQESKVITLDKEVIVIGHSNADHVDLPMDIPGICARHVVIEEQNERFVVINAANDPFTSLNGLPFGKKPLKNYDQIEIGENKIKFEFIEDDAPTTQTVEKQEDVPDEIDKLLKEVEELSKPSLETAPPPSLPAIEDQKAEEEEEEAESLSSKKYYLRDFDDESEQWSEDRLEANNIYSPGRESFADSWKMLAGLLLAIIALGAVICSGVYFRASGKNSQEEKKIAAGIADIAMAMTHAKLNHITPNKQNWSDPNFIRNNLAQVLSPNLHTQAQIDSEGQFTKYPYRLRVYTSRSLDQFIVIAQPAPNLMQWLVHKKTLVVDSSTMEMRKISDLKALNRLLANPDPLEGSNGEDIHHLIKEGGLMSLNSLAGHKNHWGFSPPKTLGFIRPGAENYIYNAPRYYPFGEELLRKAIQLYKNSSSPSDVAIIQDEMDEISNFPNIVLYTSEGLQMAVEAQKALNTFAPNSKFLVAYVKFNPKGFVASSHLLINEERREIAFLPSPRTELSTFFPTSSEMEQEPDFLSLSPIEDSLLIAEKTASDDTDLQHPLYLQLKASHQERKHALNAISRKMLELLNQQNNALLPEFEPSFSELLSEYLKTSLHYQQKIIQKLAKLYQEHTDMPLEEFVKYVDQAQLSSFAQAALDDQPTQRLTQEEIEEIFEKIDRAESLHELEHVSEQAAQTLTLENLPDTNSLIQFQEKVRTHTLNRLQFLLFSPKSLYATEPLDERDRGVLINILENSWISDPGEKDYFLSEFDHLIEEFVKSG
ncbi:putative uncharacterized protein [Waddlia chondrophila 2032/99]|uniref:FHA domain-containing protein n=2 Tax=Waddlia chondrophila TaxID=71667 RepID=D6YS29_WADCW|nr:FHA domain-containing protein [Waddlia chondrophila]ADI38874.1 hypothetical protein wcw_1525 [Waddlia chondrophila WSU 86-1044]CCB90722.1 putative uncharacterized protein [Waddlia chondrophila 2032/99]